MKEASGTNRTKSLENSKTQKKDVLVKMHKERPECQRTGLGRLRLGGRKLDKQALRKRDIKGTSPRKEGTKLGREKGTGYPQRLLLAEKRGGTRPERLGVPRGKTQRTQSGSFDRKNNHRGQAKESQWSAPIPTSGWNGFVIRWRNKIHKNELKNGNSNQEKQEKDGRRREHWRQQHKKNLTNEITRA